MRVQNRGSDGPFLASQIPIFTTGLRTSQTQQVAALHINQDLTLTEAL